MIDLRGKVALVTGGTRGIGRAISETLARAGADIIVASRKIEDCQAAAAEMTARYGVRATAIGFDAGRWDDCTRLAHEGWAAFGWIDILVNNAGVSPRYDGVENVSEELFDKIIAVNLKGPFRLAALVGTRMVEAGSGAIVVIGSSSASHPVRHSIPYSVAKAGVTNMVKGLALVLGPTVRVNGVQPAGTETDMNKNPSPEIVARFTHGHAIPRFARPEEISGAVAFLASDAASFITGAVLRVDGGMPG